MKYCLELDENGRSMYSPRDDFHDELKVHMVVTLLS